MAKVSQVAVKIDDKGRLTLPKTIRKSLGVETGDIVFLRYYKGSKQVRVARGENPFDVLAKNALKEHREGRTRTLKEFDHEHNIHK